MDLDNIYSVVGQPFLCLSLNEMSGRLCHVFVDTAEIFGRANQIYCACYDAVKTVHLQSITESYAHQKQ